MVDNQKRTNTSVGHWKLKWSRKRETSGGKFKRPRRKTWIWVEPKDNKKK